MLSKNCFNFSWFLRHSFGYCPNRCKCINALLFDMEEILDKVLTKWNALKIPQIRLQQTFRYICFLILAFLELRKVSRFRSLPHFRSFTLFLPRRKLLRYNYILENKFYRLSFCLKIISYLSSMKLWREKYSVDTSVFTHKTSITPLLNLSPQPPARTSSQYLREVRYTNSPKVETRQFSPRLFFTS